MQAKRRTVQVHCSISAMTCGGVSRPINTVNQVLNTYCANPQPANALAFLLYQLFYLAMHVVHLSVMLVD